MQDTSSLEIVRSRVLATGLVDEARISFFISAWERGLLHPREIRKVGSQLCAEEKRAEGIAFRGTITREYWDALNEHGRADPDGAAWAIAVPAMHACSVAESLARARAAGIDLFRFRASNMAAGPCPKAAALDENRVRGAKVELVPFEECTHPTQCGCLWQSWLPIMDELDD